MVDGAGTVAAEGAGTMAAWHGDADLEAQKKRHSDKKGGRWATLALACSSVGVIYGDIGTSPLYVFSSTFADPPTTPEVLGAVCLIFWTITVVVILKYVLIVLRANDSGEGGTFALYSLICRYASISAGPADAYHASDRQLSRYSSYRELPRPSKLQWGDAGSGRALRGWLNRSARAQGALLCLVLVMTSMVLGDGVLTPAQSVLGAIYGIQVKDPSLKQEVIVAVSCGIIILLFLFQRFGTSRVGFLFAPVVLLWFFLNVLVAIHNIAKYHPSIFKALSPHYAYYFFKGHLTLGWRRLAGIFLCITGAEAVYADLGHFSRPAVQLSFLGVAYPALVLTYLGQAAWLTANPEKVGSTFYSSTPWGAGFYWFFFVVATSAACVASQAMISGAFSIVRQSMALGCFPRVAIRHTSKSVEGQIYVPAVNYVMMVLTVIVVVVFKDTTKLGNAYGLAVSSMMVGTTILMLFVMLMIWDLNVGIAVAFFVVIGFIEALYLSSNLEKVPKGGWFALAVAGSVALLSHVWQWGTLTKHRRIAADKVRLEDLLAVVPSRNGDTGHANAQEESPDSVLVEATSNRPLLRNPGIGLVYSDHVAGAPPVLPIFIQRWRTLHKILILVTVRHIPVPTVEPEERVLFRKLPFPGVYRCVARYGYTDAVNHGEEFVQQLLRQVGTIPPKDEVQPASAAYVMSRPILVAKHGNPIRRFVLNNVYGCLAHFARQAWEDWNVPYTGMVEIGIVYDV